MNATPIRIIAQAEHLLEVREVRVNGVVIPWPDEVACRLQAAIDESAGWALANIEQRFRIARAAAEARYQVAREELLGLHAWPAGAPVVPGWAALGAAALFSCDVAIPAWDKAPRLAAWLEASSPPRPLQEPGSQSSPPRPTCWAVAWLRQWWFGGRS